MPDYSKGKIYKVICNETGLTYIGSTVNKLNVRLSKHKYSYKSYINGKYGYCSIFEIIKNNNYRIELLKNYPCFNEEELLKEEGICQQQNECINKKIAGRTHKERYELYYKYHNTEYTRNYRAKKKTQQLSASESDSSSSSLTTISSQPENSF